MEDNKDIYEENQLKLPPPPKPPKETPYYKMNYFGQMIYAEDFTTDQAYHEKMRWFHNQNLHSNGIIYGLDVEISASDSLIISKGAALDKKGQEIILLEKYKEVHPILDSTKKNYIYIKHENFIEPATNNNIASSCVGIKREDYNNIPSKGSPKNGWPYIQYSCKIWAEYSEYGGNEGNDGVLLAVITNDGVTWKIDGSVRVYAGSMLPHDVSCKKLTVEELNVTGSIKGVTGYLVPKGGIIMWSGSILEIPQGWALCDGKNGTPNLSGKFIVGYDQYDMDCNVVGKTGGEKKHELTLDEMPTHTHSMCDSGPHDHGINKCSILSRRDNEVLGIEDSSGTYGISESPTLTSKNGNHTHFINNSGGSMEHENRPPYYVLAFIIKL